MLNPVPSIDQTRPRRVEAFVVPERIEQRTLGPILRALSDREKQLAG